MAYLNFTQQDIVNLARKLSTLQPYLTQQDHDLLLAIFGAAAERALSSGLSKAALPEAASPGSSAEAGEQATIADLQQQLLSAYIPGNSFDSVTGSPTFSITEDPMSITQAPQPPPSEDSDEETSEPTDDNTGASQPKSQPKSKNK